MATKKIENVKMGGTWTTYMASLHGALNAGGLWQGEISQLMGMTGMAFHFIVHEDLCPSSVTVYEWLGEHTAMKDRIGVYGHHFEEFRHHHTKELVREAAVTAIKESIDRGVPAIVWGPTHIPEFGLITGYDDEDGVFYILDCLGSEDDPLLYENLGKSDVPILYVETLITSVQVDPNDSYRASLQFGLKQWNKAHQTDKKYASGREGYKNFISALKRMGEDPQFGLSYLLAVNNDAKQHLASYLSEIGNTSASLAKVAGLVPAAESCAEKFAEMAERVPFNVQSPPLVDSKTRKELINLLTACAELDEGMYTELGAILEQAEVPQPA